MARPKKVKEVVAEEVTPVAKVAKTANQKPKYTAELLIDRKYEYPAEHLPAFQKQFGKNLGFVYYGYIFNDTANYGNHPFQDGVWIHTSLVTKEEEIDGERFIFTLNSVYKVRV